MSMVLSVDPKKCTNCRLCEISCSMAKAGEFNPSKSRIRVNAFPADFAYIPVACVQCSDAPCVQVCPSGALSQSSEVVKHDPELCIGCRMCMLACPFGAVSFDSSQGVVTKCDTCDGDPECVRFCRAKALQFKQAEVAEVRSAREFARKIVEATRA